MLELVPDHPRPHPKPGEVLIEVFAASVNPIDCKARSGEVPRLINTVPRVRCNCILQG